MSNPDFDPGMADSIACKKRGHVLHSLLTLSFVEVGFSDVRYVHRGPVITSLYRQYLRLPCF